MAKNPEQELNNRAWLSKNQNEIERKYRIFLRDDNRENSFNSAEIFVNKHLSYIDLSSIGMDDTQHARLQLMKKLSGENPPPFY